ncbi:hypothetical protein SAMN02745724_00877 [Pseudoalteromonas denitrificans DSM 6059]|uniref:Uncharacterized protein n=1 Tax=Pseudoalteromonas denitrificans DSM 6059 TaxID=1123010 RepID=A0A1I1GAG5_9GAMM|nr:hypothetical protein SAMN02745724_00877 [Pseudoalteromonas denitrificans DSM 6059]
MIRIHFIVLYFALIHFNSSAHDLLVAKSCPVTFNQSPVGILVFSFPWFHNSGSDAAYIAKDNATGIGIEIHFFSNNQGQIKGKNIAKCQKYRMVQIRKTNAKLSKKHNEIEIDVPNQSTEPFYDNHLLEFGYGTHKSPIDSQDKPWKAQVMRASTVAIYDTPFVSDSYGHEGKDIKVKF